MESRFTLVPQLMSEDCVQTLTTMLAEAKSGELIGVVFAAMYRRRQYVVGACGEAARNPTFSRGMIAALDDRLGSDITTIG